MKRFYTLVSTAREPGGLTIQLDGKPVKTPLRRLLLVPRQDLADAIAHEWSVQEKDIAPDTMPLTQIATTAIDRVADERAAMTAHLLKYIDSDLLCYRTDTPEDVGRLQQAAWDPWIDWFAARAGTRLETTLALTRLSQPREIHAFWAATLASLDGLSFTVFQLTAGMTGSLVLALALLEGEIDAPALFDLIHVEEQYRARLYHEDIHGQAPHEERRQTALRRDLTAAATVAAFLRA